MTSQTLEELDDQLLEALTVHLPNDDAVDAMAAIAPALAEIRRHAAAAALRQQATRLGKISTGYVNLAVGAVPGSDSADLWAAYATQARADARLLLRAADDLIAEGWAYTCTQSTPATREDPAEGCEAPVQNEGDYCPKHEPADDDPRGEL